MANQVTHVAITMDDGSVSIMSFLTRGRGNVLPKNAEWSDIPGYWRREATDENIFHEISRSLTSGPQPVSYRIIDQSEIPTDRTFRDAWKDDGAKVVHDMPKARAIHLERLRRQREEALTQLDRDWMRASGQKKTAEANAIEGKRQAWRDMPVTINAALEAAQNVDALKIVTFAV